MAVLLANNEVGENVTKYTSQAQVLEQLQAALGNVLDLRGTFGDATKKVECIPAIIKVHLDPTEAGFAEKVRDKGSQDRIGYNLGCCIEHALTSSYVSAVIFNPATSRYDIQVTSSGSSRHMNPAEAGRMLGMGIVSFLRSVRPANFDGLRFPDSSTGTTSF